MVKLTPNIKIYLDRLGHVLKNGFDFYKKLDFDI
jgi:hypothetical protein